MIVALKQLNRQLKNAQVVIIINENNKRAKVNFLLVSKEKYLLPSL